MFDAIKPRTVCYLDHLALSVAIPDDHRPYFVRRHTYTHINTHVRTKSAHKCKNCKKNAIFRRNFSLIQNIFEIKEFMEKS